MAQKHGPRKYSLCSPKELPPFGSCPYDTSKPSQSIDLPEHGATAVTRMASRFSLEGLRIQETSVITLCPTENFGAKRIALSWHDI